VFITPGMNLCSALFLPFLLAFPSV
jgi:hypothetical protein